MAATANPEVAPLVSVLARQEAIYQQLLEVASDERQAIVAGNLADLKAALQRKQDILERLAALEDRRINWLGRYARKHGFEVETMTLASIIDSSGPSDRKALTRLHRALRMRARPGSPTSGSRSAPTRAGWEQSAAPVGHR